MGVGCTSPAAGDRTGPALSGVRAGEGWGSVVAVPPNETKEFRHG